MEIRFFDDTDAFAEVAEPYLETREAENNLPIGIIAAIRSGQYAEHPPLLTTIEDARQVVAVAIRTPPHNLLTSFEPPRDAINLLASTLWQQKADLPGVTADAATAGAFTEAWANLGGPRFELARPERIYRLTTVRPPQATAGKMRTVTQDDFALALAWLEAFALDTNEVGSGDPEGSARRFIPAQPGTRALMFWEVDGKPVSMAGYAGPTPHGMHITAVYTPPDLRRRGYASACVAALSQHLLDEGRQFCFLFTELENPTSNHIYQEIGYEAVCDVSEYRVPATT
jgi:uncharacterized protein